jgi:predicted DNA-binding protein YlxM (UPF0122 family)
MFFVDIQTLEDTAFKRLTGVTPAVFSMMVEVLQHAHRAFGRPAKLSHEDQVLVMLMYLREYRTMFHIAQSYKVSEPTVSRIIRRTETLLTSDERFQLPRRPSAESEALTVEVLVLDATETPIERPQKKSNAKSITAAKRSTTASKHRS